ncbi:MAG TPA: hypothetical protein VF177_09010 [Anaerolineae bacterium]
MDYPFFNFIFGLGLLLSNSVSIGLTILSRRRISPNLWYVLLALIIVSVLLVVYIVYLLYLSMPPGFILRLGLGLILIAGLSAGFAAVLDKGPLSPFAWRLILFVLMLSILFNFALAYLLYRSLVPEPWISITVQDSSSYLLEFVF